jgi:hypothetical protein
MSRYMIVALCAAVGFVSLAGCGSSSNPNSAEALCPSVRTAYGNYSRAMAAMGLQVQNIGYRVASKKAAEALLRRTQQLEQRAAGVHRQQLSSFNAALSDQVKTFEAFEEHNLRAVRKYSASVNEPLRKGLIDLGRICPAAK